MSELDKLVQDCQQGELAAFASLFRRYEARIYRLAMAILHDERDAEDAVQDACLRVFESSAIGPNHPSKPGSRQWWSMSVVTGCDGGRFATPSPWISSMKGRTVAIWRKRWRADCGDRRYGQWWRKWRRRADSKQHELR